MVRHNYICQRQKWHQGTVRPWWPTHHTVSEALVPATQQVPVHGGLPWGQSVMLGMADLISPPLCWFWELLWSLLRTLMHAWTFLVSVFYGSCLGALSAGLQSANINYFTSILFVSHIFQFYYNMTVESDLEFGSVLNLGPVTTCTGAKASCNTPLCCHGICMCEILCTETELGNNFNNQLLTKD